MRIASKIFAAVASVSFLIPATTVAHATEAVSHVHVSAALSAQNSTQGEAPTDTLTWGVTPVPEEGSDGDDRVSFRFDEVEPGQTIHDEVLVSNYSQQALTFSLHASDGVISEEGLFELLSGDEAPEGTGAWIDIEPEVTVPAGDALAVPFTITVPEDALPGDHPGGITAGIAAVEDAEQVSLNAVVGARIHLRVAGDIVPSVAIENLHANYQPSWNPFAPGVLELTWDVSNDGNIRLGAEQQLAVEGVFGLNAGVAEQAVAVQREILPGQHASAQLEFEAWPLGPLEARMTSQQQIVGEDDVDIAPQAVTATVSFWAIPWAQLVVLVLLVALAGGIIGARKRHKKAIAKAVADAKAEAAGRSQRDNQEHDEELHEPATL